MIISYPELVTHALRNAHMHIHDGRAHYTKNIIDASMPLQGTLNSIFLKDYLQQCTLCNNNSFKHCNIVSTVASNMTLLPLVYNLFMRIFNSVSGSSLKLKWLFYILIEFCVN